MASVGTAVGNSYACGSGNAQTRIYYSYEIGSVVFSLPAAEEGELEPVAIKRIAFTTDAYDKSLLLYVDTYNRVWNPGDLVTETDARATITAYLIYHQELLEAALEKCSGG